MITLRKLASLTDDTRRRKYPLLLQKIEYDIKNDRSVNTIYLSGLLQMICDDFFYGEIFRSDVCQLVKNISLLDGSELLWKCNAVRHSLLQAIHAEPGDWDFEESESLCRSERIIGDFYLYLDEIRSPFNVGSIFRTAESFGIKKILISPGTVSPEHRRAKRSSMGCIDLVPWSYGSLSELIEPVFALELGGQSINTFPYPPRGTLIIGSEELGVSPGGLKKADAGLGRLSINTGGMKGSINVSVATGIALQKWFSLIF
ncbi:MAG: TrmH family RNA methyltransferase [Spirochaetaceae bacterium]|nr:TrmH family RNA methyltransferase [Spirochaetaceae bacterium]